MVMEPEERAGERPQLMITVTEERGGGLEGLQNQNLTVMEIPDSTSEGDEGSRSSPVKTEERSFVAGLHCFMKGRGTPIERIPHLGFKQINLWRIYKAVENLGGYDSVTARRLWKSVYDELGGSPGSTSAATCTRRHYERLLLPFERQLRGEVDKPLPPCKPRKHYKRGVESKDCRSEGKRKRSQLEETDFAAQESPEPAQRETVERVHPAPWTLPSDQPRPDRPQSGNGRSRAVYTRPHLIPDAAASGSWGSASVPSRPGEVISPLEMKKREAQASVRLSSRSPRPDDRTDRPSVIRRSQSPGPTPAAAGRVASVDDDSPGGSPLPRSSSSSSSSSSRSSSPYSVSSEDCAAARADNGTGQELPLNYSTGRLTPAGCGSGVAARDPQSCVPIGRDPAGSPGLQAPPPPPAAVPSVRGQSRRSEWSPVRGSTPNRCTAAHYPPPPPTSCTYAVKSVWVPSSTGAAAAAAFAKARPKVVEPLRPVPYQPGYRPLQNPNRAMMMYHHDDAPSYAKKLHMAAWPFHAEKKERSRGALPKPLPTQLPLFHSGAGIPVSYLLPAAYDRTGRDARHPPVLLPANIRLAPQTQTQGPVYRHVMMGPAHAGPYEPALYSYPYPVPLWNPQTGYGVTGVNAPYPHTRL